MAADIPNCEPSSFAAGSTVRWTKSLADYSYADGWRLKYVFHGVGKLPVAADVDADGVGFSVTIKASDSAKLGAGQYRWQSWVERADEVFIVAEGNATVSPNFQTANAGDLQPTTEQELDLIEKVIKALLGTDNQSYSIGGRTFQKKELDKIMTLRGVLVAKLGRERGQDLPSYAMAFHAPR